MARLRLLEAIAVQQRNNPSNPELPALRHCLKQLVERLDIPYLP
jgi:hypothetical protein